MSKITTEDCISAARVLLHSSGIDEADRIKAAEYLFEEDNDMNDRIAAARVLINSPEESCSRAAAAVFLLHHKDDE